MVAESVIGRHVAQLGSQPKRLSITADSLFILARHMAHLNVLFGVVQSLSEQGPIAFPLGLRKLDLQIAFSVAAAELNAALQAISRATPTSAPQSAADWPWT